jgi:hypothetical protein
MILNPASEPGATEPGAPETPAGEVSVSSETPNPDAAETTTPTEKEVADGKTDNSLFVLRSGPD